MTNSELNKYIKHYLEEDKTKSAIMLTGPWGSGKSYYINHELVPFLVKDGKNQCVVVSLYGIKNISEISKSIYLELRAKALRSNNEVATTSKILAKTVAKGITSFFGVDLSASEDEMQRLYESVDLSDKLIVLEDIERSQINIFEILGYVNNLVEQDGVKVLLVANEAEMIKYDEIMDEKGKNIQKVLTEESADYLRTKEKTVSDTISFTGDYLSAMRAIIEGFKDVQLSLFTKDEYIQEIYDLFVFSKGGNLRTFIYACQKTVDILKQIDTELKFEDKRTIFYSIILFSKHIKAGSFPKWNGTEFLSTDLGNSLFPLYYFCYEYIRWQQFDKSRVAPTLASHKKMKLYQHHSGDDDLNVLYSYFTYSEDEVFNALRNIEEKLKNPEAISFYEYGKLAYYFVCCKIVLDWDYSGVKMQMLANIRKIGEEIDGDLLFLPFKEINDEKEKLLFEEFKADILAAIEDAKNKPVEIEYIPEKVATYYAAICQNKHIYRNNHRFISTFNMENVIELIFKCSAAQLHDLRGILFAVYRDSCKGQFVEQDIDFMVELKARVESGMVDKTLAKDRIVQLQLSYLCNNLQQFISQLS